MKYLQKLPRFDYSIVKRSGVICRQCSSQPYFPYESPAIPSRKLLFDLYDIDSEFDNNEASMIEEITPSTRPSFINESSSHEQIVEEVDQFRFIIDEDEFERAMIYGNNIRMNDSSTETSYSDRSNSFVFNEEFIERLKSADTSTTLDGDRVLKLEMDEDELIGMMMSSRLKLRSGIDESSTGHRGVPYDEEMMRCAEALVVDKPSRTFSTKPFSAAEEFDKLFPSTASHRSYSFGHHRYSAAFPDDFSRSIASSGLRNWSLADISGPKLHENLVGTLIIGVALTISVKLLDWIAQYSVFLGQLLIRGIDSSISTIIPTRKTVVSTFCRKVPVVLLSVIAGSIAAWIKKKREESALDNLHLYK